MSSYFFRIWCLSLNVLCMPAQPWVAGCSTFPPGTWRQCERERLLAFWLMAWRTDKGARQFGRFSGSRQAELQHGSLTLFSWVWKDREEVSKSVCASAHTHTHKKSQVHFSALVWIHLPAKKGTDPEENTIQLRKYWIRLVVHMTFL